MVDLNVPVYSFTTVPPAAPKLYFTQRHLREMAIYGTLACPRTTPTRTIFPAEGIVGRWTLHHDDGITINIFEDPDVIKQLMDQLPGTRMRYEDYATGNASVWVLTDTVLHRDNDNDLRLGVWPD